MHSHLHISIDFDLDNISANFKKITDKFSSVNNPNWVLEENTIPCIFRRSLEELSK